MPKFLSLFDRYFFWWLLGLVAFILLYPKFPLVNVPGTYVAVRLEDVLVASTTLVWLIAKLPQLKTILTEKIYLIFLLFWLAGLLSLLSAVVITQSIAPHLGILHWLRRVEYMSLFIMAATTLTSTAQVKDILRVGLVVTLIVIIYGFGQLWLDFPVISTTNREFAKGLVLHLTPDARVNSTFAGHYDLAAFLAIVLIMLGSLLVYSRSLLTRGLLAVFGIVNFLLLALTAARASFVAALAGLAISFWLLGKKWLIIVLAAVALATLVVIPELRHRLVATITVNLLGGGGPKYQISEGSGVVNTNTFLSEASRAALLNEATKSGAKISTVAADISPGEPIDTTELGVYRSFGIRLNVEWPRAIRAFLKNPLLGTGYSSLNIATDNDLLRSLGEVGILGTLALSLIFVVIIKKMIWFIGTRHFFERVFIIGVLAALLTTLLTSFYIDILEASKIALPVWFLLGSSWGLMRGSQNG